MGHQLCSHDWLSYNTYTLVLQYNATVCDTISAWVFIMTVIALFKMNKDIAVKKKNIPLIITMLKHMYIQFSGFNLLLVCVCVKHLTKLSFRMLSMLLFPSPLSHSVSEGEERTHHKMHSNALYTR